MTFNLLIKYANGEEKIVKDVEGYKFNYDQKCFVFEKNGYRGFVPMNEVLYFGRKYDYMN